MPSSGGPTCAEEADSVEPGSCCFTLGIMLVPAEHAQLSSRKALYRWNAVDLAALNAKISADGEPSDGKPTGELRGVSPRRGRCAPQEASPRGESRPRVGQFPAVGRAPLGRGPPQERCRWPGSRAQARTPRRRPVHRRALARVRRETLPSPHARACACDGEPPPPVHVSERLRDAKTAAMVSSPDITFRFERGQGTILASRCVCVYK